MTCQLTPSRRQLPCYSRPLPPPELKNHLTAEKYKKAQAYSRDKTYYSIAQHLFSFVQSLVFINGGYLWTWNFAGRIMDAFGLSRDRMVSLPTLDSLTDRQITYTIVWTVVTTVISGALSLPWSYYYTFVLEEKHGFNKQTPKLFFMDTLKTYSLLAVIGLPVLAGFLKIFDWAGKAFIPWLMLFVIAVQLVLQIIFPLWIQPLFNKFTPLPDGEVRSRVEALASKLKFPLKHLFMIDESKRSSHSNAYFYGLPWSKQIVIYDTLLDKSSPAEVEAVLAHELGHWYYNHPMRLMLVAQSHLLFTLTVFSIFIGNKALFQSFGFDPSLAVGPHRAVCIGFTLYQLLFGPIDTFVQFAMNSVTRRYEYQADAFAVGLGTKAELKTALIKLHVENLSSPHSDKLYSMYHHSHPTLPERLRAMDEYTGGEWLKPKAEHPARLATTEQKLAEEREREIEAKKEL